MIALPALFLFLAASLLSFLSVGVVAHGFVDNVTIGGKLYPGWNPDYDPYAAPPVARVIRKIPNDGPITDVRSVNISCNIGGLTGAGLVAEAEAGSKVTFKMNRWPDDHKGPIFHYMASCNGDCTNFDVSHAEWFKVDAAGYNNGVWAATELIANGLSSTMVIPSGLKPGEYLIRHEIVALHSPGAPQFYPSCAQVKVTGGGTQTPCPSDLVKIPGVYDTFQWPDIWADDFKSFTIPGPPVAFGSSGASSGGCSQAPEPVTSSARPSAASISTSAATSAHLHSSSLASAPSPAPTGKCRHKRRTSGQRSVQRHAALMHKRHH